MRRTGDDHLSTTVVVAEQDWWVADLAADDVHEIRLWSAARRAGTAWARGRADRRIAVRLATRELLGRVAATRLPDDLDAVYAPSFSARRVFAVSVQRSPAAARHLVEDIADLRQLHADLDRAAAVHPDARFLRRHRATSQQLATQEAERVLADVVHVRSQFARELRLRNGMPDDRVRVIGSSPIVGLRRPVLDAARPTLLLAGLATARNGTYEARAALDALPGATLLVRAGEGLEPMELLDHPRVRVADGRPADIVIAPAWCETHAAEVHAAVAAGVPVVATTRAARLVDLNEAGHAVEPGDVDGLVAAITFVLAR